MTLKMTRHTALALLLAGPTLANAQATTEWLVMSVKGQKIGYTKTAVSPWEGGSKSVSKSVLNGKLLGFDLALKVDSRSWSDKQGRTTRLEVDTESGGKTVKVVATFDNGKATATSTLDGRSTKHSLEYDPKVPVVDDPMTLLASGQATREFYVFDPNTLSLVICSVESRPKETVEVGGTTATLDVVFINDPRAPITAYFSAKGDFVKAVGPFGMEIRPATEAEALEESDGVDIATVSSIKTDKPIDGWNDLERLELVVTGVAVDRIPSDAHQTVRPMDNGLLLTIHPVPRGTQGKDADADGQWLKPDLHIPSDKPKFVDLARQLTQGATGPDDRAERLRTFVNGKIRADGGIGVLRDADDVLESGRGVCRDHAILLATLLRAAALPARLVSGLVYADGAFYYHAWVEALIDGSWVGLDSTRPRKTLDATHIKIGQGSVGGAFTSFLLDGAKIAVKSS